MMGTSENKKISIKSHLLKVLVAVVFVFGLTVFGGGHNADVQAATTVTGVEQVDHGTRFATVEFNVHAGDYIYYRIGESSGRYGSAIAVGQAPETKAYMYDIERLSPGKSYWVQFGSADAANTTPTNWSSAVEIVTSPDALPTLKHTKSTKKSLSFSWNAVNGANWYSVQTQKYGTTTWKEATTNKTSIEVKNLSANSAYDVLLSVARKSSTGYTAYYRYVSNGYYYRYTAELSKFCRTVTGKPSKPYLTSAYRAAGSISVGVKPQQAAEGYTFWVYEVGKTKPVVKKTVKGAYRTTIRSKALKKNCVYKFKVQSYVTDSSGKKYSSEWSEYSYFASTKNTSLDSKKSGNGVKLSWKAVKGAKKYEVYMSTSLNGKYKKVATTAKKSYVVKKYGKSALRSGKRYYVYVAPMAKVGKKYYSTNSNFVGRVSVLEFTYY